MRWCCGASCSGTPFALICGNTTNNHNGVDNVSQNSTTMLDKEKKHSNNPTTTSKKSSSTPVTVIASSNSVLVGSNRTPENSSSTIKCVSAKTKVKDKKYSFTTTSSNSFDYSPTSSLLPKNSVSESNIEDNKKTSHKKTSNILSSKLLFSGKSTKLPPVQEMPISVEVFGPMLLRSQKSAEQPIEICDQTNSIQYVNKAYEALTGLSKSQILGLKGSSMRRRSLNNLSTIRNNNVFQSSASSSITRPTTPQPLDSENLASNVGLSTTGIEVSNSNNGSNNSNQNNTSGRRKSCEWHCIPIPLTNTSYKCDEDMKPMIREAVKTLSSSELYTPQLNKMKESDRLNNGYYDGLIRVQPSLSRQRKRSVVDAFHTNKKLNDNNRRRISTDVRNALENETNWDFDVIHLERITDHHALTYLGMKIFDKWKVHEHLNCSRDIIGRWFQVIESHYHNDNTYHNATHAADVLQATSVFLESEVVAENVVDTHAIAALIAAAIHDLDHPGRGNGYLINTRQHLALLYNDQSVLENHHVALTFQITVPDKNINIFQNMNREEYNGLRQAIVDMVLATDMSRHFEYLTKFQQTLLNLPDEENREANSLAICRMMIKCADISNPVRQWKISQDWAFRIVNEYFEQTKEEIEKGLPVSLLHFNRETCNVPRTQVGFIDMFVREAFTHWCGFAQIPELLTILEENYEKWKEQIDSWKTSDNETLLSK
uniref:Phosphodiesterase n=1 Tax=Strongyloides papillosus TaxID=174720 RepID=A0A0N5C8I2_STREA